MLSVKFGIWRQALLLLLLFASVDVDVRGDTRGSRGLPRVARCSSPCVRTPSWIDVTRRFHPPGSRAAPSIACQRSPSRSASSDIEHHYRSGTQHPRPTTDHLRPLDFLFPPFQNFLTCLPTCRLTAASRSSGVADQEPRRYPIRSSAVRSFAGLFHLRARLTRCSRGAARCDARARQRFPGPPVYARAVGGIVSGCRLT
jgi:hypothetical protein